MKLLPEDIRILVACEESQAVCSAFLERGFDAYSCDLKETSGKYPWRHIVSDALHVVRSGHYDVLIAHPPCTYLSKVSAPHMFPNKQNMFIPKDHRDAPCPDRFDQMRKARDFFMNLFTANVKYVAVENPIPLRISALPAPSCIVQPYEHGHEYSKATCLWLRNLPPLLPTLYAPSWKSFTDSVRDPKNRSKTFPGIAKAMADQWGSFILKDLNIH
jgi:hypothetical protein